MDSKCSGCIKSNMGEWGIKDFRKIVKERIMSGFVKKNSVPPPVPDPAGNPGRGLAISSRF